MLSSKQVIAQAKKVLNIEANAVKGLNASINADFVKAVNLLYNCKGRVIVTGMGKPGIIARKIAATMASTGTPALFMHSAEGAHGDIGSVVKNDVLIIISNSGETKEVLDVLPSVKRIGARLIALTGGKDSTLAKNSDVVINTSVKTEACPLGLAPTASTAAELAMGDALAVVLLLKRGFKPEDYALLHPGGSLGHQLLKIEDIMRKGGEVPVVKESAGMEKVIMEMNSKKMGCTAVVDAKNRLTGIITDQNLRNHLESGKKLFSKRAKDIMTKNPKTINKNALVSEGIKMTEEKSISTLLAVGKPRELLGIVHLHDLLRSSK